ncbi:MAG: DNA-processing protein DprA [Candidatus Borkfalkiaceae bacterium]|nr:DNA-processing protein DprA [Clostridia bacterium]MDY6223603.1 DNA-processing protein DprA [Christensenellaceae bacterium]
MQSYSAEERAFLWLDAFSLPLAEKNALLKIAGSAVNLVKNCAEILEKTVKHNDSGVYKDMVDSLKDDRFYKNATAATQEHGVTAYPRVSEGFFEAWKDLPQPPLVQYEKGNAALKNRDKFVIVGSRRTNSDTMKRTRTIAADLSDCFTVVTGNADGADEAALSGAEQNGGGISVLAGGLCALENARCDFSKNLYVSEHPYFTPVRTFSYERRNLLLAALGKGALIVSAGEKSGALITARYVRQGKKPLFAFPYSPEAAAGRGCNRLIKDGAYLTECADDVFEKLSVSRGDKIRANGAEKTKTVLSGDEKTVYEALKDTGKANVNALCRVTGLPVWKLSGVIAALEVKGVLTRTGGNFVCLV